MAGWFRAVRYWMNRTVLPISMITTLCLLYTLTWYANQLSDDEEVAQQMLIQQKVPLIKLDDTPKIRLGEPHEQPQKPRTKKSLTKTMAKLVHLDLKGAAPKVDYYKQVFPLFKNWGATGLLIEYEDMFPYSGELSVLARKTAYKPEEVKAILNLAKDNKLVVIPLIQTFGHMEFVLKHAQFQELREFSNASTVINAVKPKAFDLIKRMINQVMALHPDVTMIHIGSDEVRHLGVSPESKDFMKKHKTDKAGLFIHHVEKVASFVKEKHPQIHRSIVWHDMLRTATLQQLQNSTLKNLVEPMMWMYTKDTWDAMKEDVWKKFAKVFPNIWVASAFKGATGKAEIVLPINHHLTNHMSWIKAIDEHLSDMFSKVNGVAITGWQRYNHRSPLCQLLPVGLPSLALNLEVLGNGGYDEKVKKRVEEALKCDGPLELTLEKSKTRCKFPGSGVFDATSRLHQAKILYDKVMNKDEIEHIKLIQQHYAALIKELGALEGIFHTEFKKIFYPDAEKEFIDERVTILKTTLADYYNKKFAEKAKPKATPKATPKAKQ